jgi:hypothetical protein
MPCAFAPKAIIVLNRHERDEENPRRGVSAIRQARREGSFSLFLPFHARERKAERGWGGGRRGEGGREGLSRDQKRRDGGGEIGGGVCDFRLVGAASLPPPFPHSLPPREREENPRQRKPRTGRRGERGRARAEPRDRGRAIFPSRSDLSHDFPSPPLPSSRGGSRASRS